MMGTPAFAVPTLDALLDHHEVAAVFTRPDRAKGRGRRLVASPVKQRALERGVTIEQPSTLRDPSAVATLQALEPDAIVVAAYGFILPREVLDIPPHGCVNVHASLLPRWRGAAPIQRAILAGDEIAGVSIMRMEEGLDTGPWCLQASAVVDGKNAAELTDELALLGADSLLEALTQIETGSVRWTSQDDALATYAAKIGPDDVALLPILSVAEGARRVRASGTSAPCRVTVGDRRLVVIAAHRVDTALAPGEAVCAGSLDLGLADGALRLDVIVPEGRSRMAADAFLRGAHLPDACAWGAL